MTNKETYKALCEAADIPLFMQYWWLEGVCAGKHWDVLIVRESGGEGGSEDLSSVIAALPYETDRWLWRRHVTPSELTPYSGLWLRDDVKTDTERMRFVCLQIDDQLREAKIRAFHQRFYPDSGVPENALTSCGFKLLLRRTYMLDDVSDLDKVLAGFSRGKRRRLERETLTYSVGDIEAEKFYRFHVATCRQKNRHIWYTREMLLVVAEKALQRGRCRIIGVRDSHGELLAAAVLVWDTTTAYLLLNTFDHDQPAGGSREMLTFEAIKHARTIGVKLDFCSSRDYLKKYGAKRHNLLSVHQGSLPFVAMQRLVDWWRN